MRNRKICKSCLIVLLLICLLFAFTVSGEAEIKGKHNITVKEYTTYIGSTLDYVLNKEFPLYFMDGVDDLPYVNLQNWAGMLYFINTEILNDSGYDLEMERNGNVISFIRENGYELQFDFEKDQLFFEDYDAFMHHSNDSTLIDLVSEKGVDENGNSELIWRNGRASFDRYGDNLTIDLNAYGIHMIAQDDEYYVPLQTLNDFTLLQASSGFVFNGEALFLANDDIFYSYQEDAYTEVARKYYEAPERDRSDALADYSYKELSLVLDTFYGLKEIHDIKSFRELFWQIGYDEVLSGNDSLDADNALKSFIDYYLDDLHSTFNEYSAFAGRNSIEGSKGIANVKLENHIEGYKNARKAAYPDGYLAYEEVGNTAFITFDSFKSNYYGRAFYTAKENGQWLDDTVGQIIEAHAMITRENSPIENVVLDLSINTGGDVDAAVVVLSWFLGEAPFSVKNMATGGASTAIYRADINLDHQYDEKDTVMDKNLFCLISPVSFSCGNLVPAAFKYSQEVTLLGRTSGGGSCTVQPMTTASGAIFQMSSPFRMSFIKNGSFYDIDTGVEPDYYIKNLSNFYNREALTEYINNLF